jgi:hypothetical protein
MSEERNDKNTVFSGGETRATAVPAGIREDMGLDIPIELIPLPSGGKVYPEGSALYNKASVEIVPMTAREEDILTSRALIKKGTVISALIKSCLADKSIDVAEMISGDRNAVMTAIRITGYGPEYRGEMSCSECEAKYTQTFMLNQLPIKELEIDPVSPGKNEFDFLLPTGKQVTFKFLTGKDEEEITATQEKMKKIGMADNLITTRLQYSLVSVGNERDKGKISLYIRKMPARDSLALRQYIDKVEPGVEMRQVAECTACGHADEVDVPMGVGFFWPQAVR